MDKRQKVVISKLIRLPDDMLFEVFMFMTQREIILKVSMVSWRFRWICLSRVRLQKFVQTSDIMQDKILVANEEVFDETKKLCCGNTRPCPGVPDDECERGNSVCLTCDNKKFCPSCKSYLYCYHCLERIRENRNAGICNVCDIGKNFDHF